MNVLQQLGRSILDTEFVSRKLKRYREDADYRYDVQEGVVFTALTVGGFAVFFGGLIYLAVKLDPADASWVAMTSEVAANAADDGLTLSTELLEAIAVEGRHFFETPVGMYVVEYYSDLPVFV